MNQYTLKAFKILTEKFRILHPQEALTQRDDQVLLFSDRATLNARKLQVIFGSLSLFGFENNESIQLSYLMDHIDLDNKYAETVGRHEFRNFIMNKIRLDDRIMEAAFPLIVNGKRYWIRMCSYPMKNHPEIIIYELTDIAHIMIDEEIVYEKTHKDALTGLWNKYTFDFHYSMRLNKPHFHLLYLDLDNFKEVNDLYGHYVGNQVLIEFASLLKQYESEYNLFYRIGGDEFIGLFFVEEEKIKQIADEIVKKTRKISYQGIQIPITVSIGIIKSTLGKDVTNKADMVLYKVKENGKNHFIYEIETEST